MAQPLLAVRFVQGPSRLTDSLRARTAKSCCATRNERARLALDMVKSAQSRMNTGKLSMADFLESPIHAFNASTMMKREGDKS